VLDRLDFINSPAGLGGIEAASEGLEKVPEQHRYRFAAWVVGFDAALGVPEPATAAILHVEVGLKEGGGLRAADRRGSGFVPLGGMVEH
jgi:hypothetical protein